jgi:hypothetical protein
VRFDWPRKLRGPNLTPMGNSRACVAGALCGLLAVSLAGCSGDSKGTTASATPSQTAPSSASSTPLKASAGDKTACKNYLRILPMMQEGFGGLTKTPLAEVPALFTKFAVALDRGTGMATSPTLARPLKGTAAGWRAAAARAQIYPPGGVLNLNAELKEVHQQSQSVATFCSTVDPTGSYFAIGSLR